MDCVYTAQYLFRDNLEKVMRLVEILNYSDRCHILTVGSSRKDNATPTEYTDFPQIDKIRFPQIRFSKLLVLTESEKEYVREFNDKKYIPELLFEDKEMVNRIQFHPMALWKTRSR